jgi:hypothetical protein
MKKIYIFCFLLVFGITSCATANQKNTEVSFYLVGNTVNLDDIHKNDLRGVVLNYSPVFTTKDIIEYSQSEHSIKLTKEAFKEFLALKVGAVFAFCVDSKPVYLGVVWSPIRSSSFNSVAAIASLVDKNKIQILAGYPDGSFFEGIDPRSNKLILDSLRNSNKLVK